MSIYLKHFGLTREPFSIVPDPGFLYPSNHHRQAVAHLKYGLDREGGFILLTGEVGTGKTTLTRTMLKRLPAHVRVAYVLNSKLEVGDALASICHELAIELPPTPGLSFSKICIDALNQDLLQAHAEGKKTLIVIEEAQNLTAEVLEALRLLSNLETHTHKLLHILLVGQPELLETLALKGLRQLNQRVVSRFHLLPLEKDELSNYVNHRLHRAGAKSPLFDRNCMAVLFRLTGGVPRLINLVCQHSLLAAYATGAQSVTPKLIKQAANEILGSQDTGQRKPKWWLIAVPLLAVVAWWGYNAHWWELPASLQAENIALLEPVEVRHNSAETMPLEELQELKDPQLEEALQSVKEPQLLEEPQPVEEPQLVEAPQLIEAPQPTINPFTGLFALWSVDESQIFSEQGFVSLAGFYGLRAEVIDRAEIIDLHKINRPGIVWLREQTGYLKSYLLTHADKEQLTLIQGSKVLQLSQQAFAESWSGRFLYLWQPPVSLQTLKLGDRDPQAVAWLQDKLNAIDPGVESLITGGRYTQATVEQVLNFQRQQNIKADGVVGRETLMRINQLTNVELPLLLKVQD